MYSFLNRLFTFIAFPEWDRELFIWLNSHYATWLDPVMVLLSDYTAWFVVFTLIIITMLLKDSVTGKAATLFLLIGVALNSFLNQVVKFLIMRPRPGNDNLLTEFFRELEDTGSSYSFFSAHSSTSICLALFSALYFRSPLYSVLIFIWAFGVAYSRIYVGKHYPLDVFTGILFGLVTGYAAYRMYLNYNKRNRIFPKEVE